MTTIFGIATVTSFFATEMAECLRTTIYNKLLRDDISCELQFPLGRMTLPLSSLSSQIPTGVHHVTFNAYANTQCIPHFFSTLKEGISAGKRRSLYLRSGKVQ
jgi:hypothetical protein